MSQATSNAQMVTKGRRIIIFGAGLIGQRLCLSSQKNHDEILFFADNNSKYWDTDLYVNGIRYPVLNPDAIKDAPCDVICIAVKNAVDEICDQCMTMGVPREKIDCSFLEGFINQIGQQYLKCRDWFLESFSIIAKMHGISGAVAEVGVFRGAFASHINRCFPDRILYLYDTFEGFDDRDIEQEAMLSGQTEELENWRNSLGNFSNTSVDYVLSQMPYPQQCRIRKGYFPETFAEHDEQFAFVNLDCDLYSHIKAGLETFFPRMSRGGVILVHEYFDEASFLPGIKQAVNEFVQEHDCVVMPIGDKQSIAVIKH